jgi:hypothetical protein
LDGWSPQGGFERLNDLLDEGDIWPPSFRLLRVNSCLSGASMPTSEDRSKAAAQCGKLEGLSLAKLRHRAFF